MAPSNQWQLVKATTAGPRNQLQLVKDFIDDNKQQMKISQSLHW